MSLRRAILWRRRLAGVLAQRCPIEKSPARRRRHEELVSSDTTPYFTLGPIASLQDVSSVFHESVITSCYTEWFLGGVLSTLGCLVWRIYLARLSHNQFFADFKWSPDPTCLQWLKPLPKALETVGLKPGPPRRNKIAGAARRLRGLETQNIWTRYRPNHRSTCPRRSSRHW